MDLWDGGSGLFYIKSTCAGGGIVAADAGDERVAAAAGYGNGDGSVAAASVGNGIVSTDAAGGVIVAGAAGYGGAVGCMEVSG